MLRWPSREVNALATKAASAIGDGAAPASPEAAAGEGRGGGVDFDGLWSLVMGD
jgi:hypothetical protein